MDTLRPAPGPFKHNRRLPHTILGHPAPGPESSSADWTDPLANIRELVEFPGDRRKRQMSNVVKAHHNLVQERREDAFHLHLTDHVANLVDILWKSARRNTTSVKPLKSTRHRLSIHIRFGDFGSYWDQMDRYTEEIRVLHKRQEVMKLKCHRVFNKPQEGDKPRRMDIYGYVPGDWAGSLIGWSEEASKQEAKRREDGQLKHLDLKAWGITQEELDAETQRLDQQQEEQ